ncbi:deoxyguanosinetriphosphate triphosphohydrolase [Jiella sp. MQZ9-1]|uniref:Deoxyguanosinetriphosphate triphosphohydrolase-like protein n=1 Tax=Jiella flava TaxID=2816857 RepID=A0A939JVS5_9HYPH|nr:deoxyguanosinetriphosphate triphosphohydrolase [Jiella flava]MBO0662779.1 deoxyguanosinetriphosphate triphosphohydrolase [Jiella flava]MCD2471200.1 deoxyguanosinetriphosphate triphosphohydrolase [Jiella flava]
MGGTAQAFQTGCGQIGRAAYAEQPGVSRGRVVPESDSPTRTPFQRDRDRIVHSAAFRRLKHKTQVFVPYEGDHFRTRLTHTIEVSQIARALARAFRLDEDLTEAVALVHDFGHTPFGHAGERALDRRMQAYGGFEHNAQSLRIVTTLESRYADFDGLNLAFETLEGLVKHNGPLTGPNAAKSHPVPRPILDFDASFPLGLDRFADLEAQCAAISDDIAYNTHDLDDGLRAGLINLCDIEELDLAGSIFRDVRERYPGLDHSRTVHEIMRRHITRLVEDVIGTTNAELERAAPQSADAVRDAGRQLVRFSETMERAVTQTRHFLFRKVYRCESVMRVMCEAERVVEALFDRFVERPELMPRDWALGVGDLADDKLARRIADYLSGMTDTYAIAEYQRLFDAVPQLR